MGPPASSKGLLHLQKGPDSVAHMNTVPGLALVPGHMPVMLSNTAQMEFVIHQ